MDASVEMSPSSDLAVVDLQSPDMVSSCRLLRSSGADCFVLTNHGDADAGADCFGNTQAGMEALALWECLYTATYGECSSACFPDGGSIPYAPAETYCESCTLGTCAAGCNPLLIICGACNGGPCSDLYNACN
jgi:hypothetical protein